MPSFSLSFKYKLPVFLSSCLQRSWASRVLGTLSGEILEVLVMGRLNPKFVGPWEGEEPSLCRLLVFGRYTLWSFRQGETTLTSLENEEDAIKAGRLQREKMWGE